MQRRATNTTRGANAEERRFMAYTKESDCIVCGNCGPSIVDHAMGATFKHNKTLIGHWFVIPLCLSCDNKKTSRRIFTNEFGLMSEMWINHVNNGEFDPPLNVVMAIEDCRR